MSFLGIDLGTSGIRALLIDENGAPIGSAERHYSVSVPQPGWSEQDPADWITACETALDTLRAEAPEAIRDLKGIGLSGHMHGATLIDADDKVLRPCIQLSWMWALRPSVVVATELRNCVRVMWVSS